MKKFILKKIYQHIKLRNKKLKNSKILIAGLTYKYGVSDMRNSLNFEIYKKIKKNINRTFAYDPFSKANNFTKPNNLSALIKFDIVIFLSKGLIFQKLYKKIKSKKPEIILDPFYYYNN